MTADQYPKIYFYRRLVQAKLYIDMHYAENIDLDNISDEACFSKFHFVRQFKNIYRRTPHQYLIFVRMKKAMELLKAGVPVTDACYEVGFESVSTFSGLFRRITGEPPSRYLARHQELRAQMIRSPLTYVPGCFAEKNGWFRD
ncbi:helix-turn-helix transcriptional regulator [Chitinophaga sp. Mgbs1]|uniref:Helix-turn-helix transcriptional regulator n=1 Tax=Chitinophaga solisilvae TaxID=1233460 RepID=A0A433WG59_9BACT|nr:helix-turn-helix transcriptional regulator [Chitinophaga solisilvae]